MHNKIIPPDVILRCPTDQPPQAHLIHSKRLWQVSQSGEVDILGKKVVPGMIKVPEKRNLKSSRSRRRTQ